MRNSQRTSLRREYRAGYCEAVRWRNAADIHENRELSDEDRERVTAQRTEFTWHLATSIKPVIGAINGLCYGGGTVMATSMDFLLGCEKTSFRFLAVNYGQMNATWSLPTMVGWPKAKELLYSGREVFADEAYKIGLLNHLVPGENLLEKAVEVAAGIAKNRIEGVANIKQKHEIISRPTKSLNHLT